MRAVVDKPTEREKAVKKMADKCVRFMKDRSLKAAKDGHQAPTFSTAELMNGACVPDQFELRWDVARAIFDAMTLASEMGMVQKGYGRGGSWTYTGSEIEKVRKALEKARRDRRAKISSAAKRRGVKIRIGAYGHRLDVSLSGEDFLKLAAR